MVWASADSQARPQILSQLFDANGLAIGSSLAVSEPTTGASGARVEALSDSGEGSHVVVMNNDSARVYNGLKKKYGDAFSIAMQSIPGQKFGFSIADVCPYGKSGFAIAYQDAPANFDIPSYSVYVRQFDVNLKNSTLRPVGNGFLVNTAQSQTAGTNDSATIPAISGDDLANLCVVWAGNGASGFSDVIYLRSIDRWNNLSPQVIVVNRPDSDAKIVNSPAVSSLQGGNFVVAWCSHTTGRAETNRITIRHQRYGVESGSASAIGENTTTTRPDKSSFGPRVIHLEDGRLLVTWWTSLVAGSVILKARVYATS